MSRIVILLFVVLFVVIMVGLPTTVSEFQDPQRIIRVATWEPIRLKRSYGYGGFRGRFGGRRHYGYGGHRGFGHGGFGRGCRRCWGSRYPGSFANSGAFAGSISTPFGSGSFAHSFANSGGYGR